MHTVKLSTKGQIVIPLDIRKAGHLVAGMELSVVLVGDEIRIKPIPPLRRTSVEEAAGCLHSSLHRPLSDEETEQAIGAMLLTEDESTRS
jgi:AbrB family looped-hinge helix DNA binding protein